MANSVVFPRAQFFSNSGRPLVGGRIHTYVAGSSTRARTYQDAANVQINTNPIILDARGEAAIYLAEGVEYKFVVEDSTGALIMTQEPVYGAIWPNASEWPSDATLSYQYMTEARAAASASGPIAFFGTYAAAQAAVGGLPDGGIVEISQDETRAGARTRYKVQAGALVFVVNLDQTRLDLAAATGASLVGYQPAGTGAVSTTVQGKLREFVSVKDFGAKGDGVTDDAPSISAAIAATGEGGTLEFPQGTYLCNSALVQLRSQTWKGGEGQRASTLKKGFNGDLVTLGTLGAVVGINLDGVGATYTGRGFYVADGFSQRLERCRAFDTKGPSLEFANNQGGGAHVSDFEGNTVDPTSVPAILLAGDTGPHPRFFEGIWLSGGIFGLGISAGNGCSMTGFYIRNFVCSGNTTDTGAVLMHISNGRVASGSDTTTISGADCTFNNVAFSGPVYLDNAQGMKFASCTFSAGITANQATCQYNSYDDQRKEYTPLWSQVSGAQPSLGNGTLAGSYVRHGYLVTVSVRLVIGSTTTTGNGDTAWRFSIPTNSHQSINQRGIPAFITVGTTDYLASITLAANDNSVTLGIKSAAVRDGYPVVWAEGNAIDMQFTYMAR